MSKLNRDEEPPREESTIVIPQETYYLDDEYKQNNEDNSRFSEHLHSSKKLIRVLSMDEIPNFQHSKLEVDTMWESL